MSQGYFESDEDYRKRMTQEANERIVEDSTGRAPWQGYFEKHGAYRKRITVEAHEGRTNARVVPERTAPPSCSCDGGGSASSSGASASSSSPASIGAGIVILSVLGCVILSLWMKSSGTNTPPTS